MVLTSRTILTNVLCKMVIFGIIIAGILQVSSVSMMHEHDDAPFQIMEITQKDSYIHQIQSRGSNNTTYMIDTRINIVKLPKGMESLWAVKPSKDDLESNYHLSALLVEKNDSREEPIPNQTIYLNIITWDYQGLRIEHSFFNKTNTTGIADFDVRSFLTYIYDTQENGTGAGGKIILNFNGDDHYYGTSYEENFFMGSFRIKPSSSSGTFYDRFPCEKVYVQVGLIIFVVVLALVCYLIYRYTKS